MKSVCTVPDSLFKSKPMPGAILNDWTGMDFTVTMGLWEGEEDGAYKTFSSFQIRDADKNIKPKGKIGKIGKYGGDPVCSSYHQLDTEVT